MHLRSSSFRHKSTFLALSLAVALPCAAQSSPTKIPTPSIAELRTGFKTPPPAARLRCYWWWLNGNTDAVTITHDLEEMKAKGFGGALLVDASGASQEGNRDVPVGPTFGSKEWTALFLHALKEADRLGLEITLSITSGWNLGGPGVTPEHASKILTWSRVKVKGGAAVNIMLPTPQTKNGFYRQIAVLAYPLAHGVALAPQPGSNSAQGGASKASVEKRSALILRLRSVGASNAESGFSMPDTSDMLLDQLPGDPAGSAGFADTTLAVSRDVTAKVGTGGSLTWTPPVGDWEILTIGYTDSGALVSTSSGAWQGLAIDYLNRDAFESYWSKTVQPLVIAAKPFHSLKSLATDSWELGGTNWTDGFREKFIQRRGYDPVPWLPVIAGRIVDSYDQSTRFLTDFRRTVADLIASDHYDVFAAKAAEYGLGMQAESGGPHGAPIDALETFRHSEVPQTEFWSPSLHRATDESRFFAKEAASAAHIYGQRFVAAEGETSIGPQWSESLARDLKPSFDMAVTEGMNRLVWHEFTSSPASTGLPGQEYFAGTHLNPKITWWEAGTPFFTYLNRGQYLMQQGIPIADLLYFYGDNVPNFVRLKSDDPAHVLPGYDYDVTNEDALLHTIRMEGGTLTGPSGVSWKALALPTTGRVSLAVLERVEKYVAQGGTLIALPPHSTTGQQTPDAQLAFRVLVSGIWGTDCASGSNHLYRKGRVFCTTNSHAALEAMKIMPDLTVTGEEQSPLSAHSESPLDYIHQRIGPLDVYYIRNGSSNPSRHNVAFRVNASLPELWDPLTGKMAPAPGSNLLSDGRVEIPLDLPPYGSSILVFGGARGNRRAPPVRTKLTIELNTLSPWKITFQPGRGAPETPVDANTLKSWSDSSDPAVRYFSGTATYHAQVAAPSVPAGAHIWLRFSDLREIAHIAINGREAGAVWSEPLMLRVDHFLKPGRNEISIAVTNLWPNRIIGDRQPGTTKHYTATNITNYRADSPLLPSGIIGQMDWVIER